MAIASSGAISISDISSEFGGSGARSLSDYYAGAGLVASLLTVTDGNAVPSAMRNLDRPPSFATGDVSPDASVLYLATGPVGRTKGET